MTATFGATYARHYDLLYRDKDYDGEVALLVRLLDRHGAEGCRVLDIGCGTGQHAVRLASCGFDVTGIDRAAAMLVLARANATRSLDDAAARPRFVAGDARTFRLGGAPFDVALMMFGVLGYQLGNREVRDALDTVRAHLKPGGLFVCDVWYGPAVLAVRPSERTKVVDTVDGHVERSARGTLDDFTHQVAVHYDLRHVRDSEVVSEVHETHRMRFFFAQELALFFETAGLEMLALHAFDDPEKDPGDDTWNVLAIGRAVQPPSLPSPVPGNVVNGPVRRGTPPLQ
ncbi:MAG: class I SAM-dependent methyltransferase [Gemmatimonadaceae bacterium]|nr:class I SAM-dependent methyltransferase [Gemmatimonadaceae bacterium]